MDRKRLASWITVPAMAVGTSVLVAAAPAHSAVTAISCTGWDHATFSPGLTNTLRSTTVTNDEDLNVIDAFSPTGSCLAVGSAATAGELDVAVVAPVSCTQIISLTGTHTIDWNDGQSSTIPYTATIVRGNSTTVITLTGTVSSGEFSGDSVVQTYTALNTAFAACSSPGGLLSLDLALTLTITGL